MDVKKLDPRAYLTAIQDKLEIQKYLEAWSPSKLFGDCEFSSQMYNSYFGIEFTKVCCYENTHIPKRMMQCNGVEDDILGIILPKSNRDGIFIAKKRDNPEKFHYKSPEVHRAMDLFAHYPISFRFNGCKIMSWNVEGRCDSWYSKPMVEDRKTKMLEFIKKEYPDILCIQNFFVRKNMAYSATATVSKELESLIRVLPKSRVRMYKHFYDGYTDVILVKPELIGASTNSTMDEPDGIKPVFVQRYNDQNKKMTILEIKNKPKENIPTAKEEKEEEEKEKAKREEEGKGKVKVKEEVKEKEKETDAPLKRLPFYIVNVHLKTPKTITSNHELELAELLAQLNRMDKFNTLPAVLIGTFNRDNAEELLTKSRKLSMRGGKIKRSSMSSRRLKSAKVSRVAGLVKQVKQVKHVKQAGRLSRVPSSRIPGRSQTRKSYKMRLV